MRWKANVAERDGPELIRRRRRFRTNIHKANRISANAMMQSTDTPAIMPGLIAGRNSSLVCVNVDELDGSADVCEWVALDKKDVRKLEFDVAPSGAVMMGEMDEVDTVEMGVTVDMGKDGIVALGGMGTCEREAEVTARGVDSGGSDGSESTVLDGREEGGRDDDSTNVIENPGPNGDRDGDVR